LDKLKGLLEGMEGIKQNQTSQPVNNISVKPKINDSRNELTPVNDNKTSPCAIELSEVEDDTADFPPKDIELYKYDVKEKSYYESPRKPKQPDIKIKKHKDSKPEKVRRNYSKGPTIINHVSINIYSETKTTDISLANVLKKIEKEGDKALLPKDQEVKRINIQEPGQIAEDKDRKHTRSPKFLKHKRSRSRSRSRYHGRRDKHKKTYRSRSKSKHRSRSRSKVRHRKRDRSSTNSFSSLSIH
jgi:hypothetical protein